MDQLEEMWDSIGVRASSGNRCIGVLDASSLSASKSNAYSDEEVSFLSLVANQVAVAMDDALNFEASRLAQAQLERKKERLKLLLDLSNNIASNLDLRDLLRAISASVRQVMHCDVVGVGLPDPETKQLRLFALDYLANTGITKEEGSVLKDHSLFHRVLDSRETLMVNGSELAQLDPLDRPALPEGFQTIVPSR